MPRAKSKKSEITKQSLMKAAHQLFHEKGFENTSVREITEAAGVSKGTFYLYFETKFDILKFFTQDYLLGFQKIIAETIVPETEDYSRQIELILDRILVEINNNKCCMYLLHSKEMSQLLEEIDAKEMLEEAFIKPMADFIRRGIETGEFRRLDAVFYAKLIMMICHQVLEGALLYEYPGDVTLTRNALYEVILKILKA